MVCDNKAQLDHTFPIYQYKVKWDIQLTNLCESYRLVLAVLVTVVGMRHLDRFAQHGGITGNLYMVLNGESMHS